METTPVSEIIEQHQKIGSKDFTKWIIRSEKYLLQKAISSKTILLIFQKHQELNSFEFTKWIICKTTELLKSEESDIETQSNYKS
jgi:hypothetical protein